MSKAVHLADTENAELIGSLANERDRLKKAGLTGAGVQSVLDKINSLMAPDVARLTITAQTVENVRDEGREILIDNIDASVLGTKTYNMLRVTFGYTHLRTLGDLSKLTEKQLKYLKFSDEIIEEIQKALDLYYLGMDKF